MTTVVTVDVTVEVIVFWWGSKFPKKYNRCWGLNLAGTRPSTDEMAPSPSFTAANGESFPNQITLNTTPSNLSSSNRQINAPVPRTTGRRREEGTDQRRCYGRWQHGGPSETATARTTAGRKDPPNNSTKSLPVSSAIINQSVLNINLSIMISNLDLAVDECYLPRNLSCGLTDWVDLRCKRCSLYINNSVLIRIFISAKAIISQKSNTTNLCTWAFSAD